MAQHPNVAARVRVCVGPQVPRNVNLCMMAISALNLLFVLVAVRHTGRTAPERVAVRP